MANERDELIERVAGAWRDRGPSGEVRSLPAWHDLDEAGRLEAFDAAVHSRALEAALDPDGSSATVRAVLQRLSR